ncbi:MAG TPA: hypothetical protein PKN75_12680 [Bacteroidia bacterium]|nr:hypothetical protein [Bacteroidia bacterium]
MSYKNRKIILIGSLVLLFYVSWKLAISKTIDEIRLNKEYEARLNGINDLPNEIVELKKYLADNEKSEYLLVESDTDATKRILDVVTRFCDGNSLLLSSFDKVNKTQINDLILLTQTFKVEGGYNSLLKLIYHLEKQEVTGKVSSVKFFKTKNFHSSREALSATVYIQNVKKM